MTTFAEAIYNANAFRSRSTQGNSIAVYQGNMVCSMNDGASVYVGYPSIPWREIREFTKKQHDLVKTFNHSYTVEWIDTLYMHHPKPQVIKPLRKTDVNGELTFVDGSVVVAGMKWSLDLVLRNGHRVYPEVSLPSWIPVRMIHEQITPFFKDCKFYPISPKTFKELWKNKKNIPKTEGKQLATISQKGKSLVLCHDSNQGGEHGYILSTMLPKSKPFDSVTFDMAQFQNAVFTEPLEMGWCKKGVLFRWGVHRAMIFSE